MKNKRRILVGLFILGLVLISIGGTFAWFSYSKNGIKENTISSGAIKFHYEEKSQGLSLNDAMPMTDEQGMAQNNYFEFEVTSKTSEFIDIPYYITVKRMETETNMDSVIKVYLTKIDGNSEVPVEIVSGKQIATFSELGSYANTDGINISLTEKLLHRDVVFAGSSSYTQKYRLRMWMDINTQILVQENGVDYYPYQDKTYTLKVNVYGNGINIGTAEKTLRANTDITDIELDSDVLTTATDTFNHEIVLPVGGTPTAKQMTVNTVNPNAIVAVDNLTPTAFLEQENNIKRLASSNQISLKIGTNTFRITVQPEDKSTSATYNLIIDVNPTYTITFDKQSGTGGTSSVDVVFNHAMPSATAPTREGYTFDGYYTEENGNGVKYYNSAMESVKNWDKNANPTLYAKWIANSTSVTFDKQSGTGGTNSVTATYDSNMPSITVPTRVGYTFDGYYTEENGGGTKYYNANGESVRTWNITDSTKTLYAKWTIISYSITYDLGGGSLSAGYPTSYNIETDSVSLPSPSRSNYIFTGWTGSNGATQSVSVTIPKGSTGDKNYTANWQGNFQQASLRKFNSSDTTVSTSFNSSNGVYTITQQGGSSGWGVGVICDDSTTPIAWGQTYALQFKVYVPSEQTIRFDANVMYMDGSQPNGNDDYGDSYFIVDGVRYSETSVVLSAGVWHDAALYLVNNNNTKNSGHKNFKSFSGFGLNLTNKGTVTYQMKELHSAVY